MREEHWLRYGVTARRKRNMRRLGELQAMRSRFRGHRGAEGLGDHGRQRCRRIRQAGHRGQEHREELRRPDGRQGLLDPHPARRPHRPRRAERRRQDDAAQDADRRDRARRGSVRLGTNLEIATLDQKREDVDPEETLAHFLTDGRGETVVVNGEERHVVSYMKDFLFKAGAGAHAGQGAVRRRAGAADRWPGVLSRPANLLVLDEPTNDLDMETLELLQELVAGFAGTVILVSHDRDFLDRTVTSIDRARRRRPLDRICRRLFRHAGAARRHEASTSRRAKAEAGGQPARGAEARRRRTGAPAKKLSYKQKFALENLPKKMAAVSASISALENRLADPGLLRAQPGFFQKTIAALDKERRSRWRRWRRNGWSSRC